MIQITPMWAAILAGFLVFLVYTACVMFAWLIYMMYNKKYNLDILVRDSTHSHPILRLEKGRISDHRRYGPHISIKRTGEVLPRFSDDHFFPSRKAGRKIIDVTKKEDLYTANDWRIIAKQPEKQEEIEAYLRGETSKVMPVLYKMADFITQPISFNARTFAFTQKDIINEKTAPDAGFWDKHKGAIIALSMVGAAMVVCVVMVIFTQQYADGLIQSASGNAASNAAQMAQRMIENAPKG